MQKICPSQYQEIYSQYFDEKISASKIGKKYGVTNSTILKILRQDGRPIRSAAGHHTRADANERLDEIAKMRREGATVQVIATHLSVSLETISEHLQNLGFDKIPRKWNPDRKAIAQRVLALYRIEMHQKDIENRLGLGRGYARKLLAFSDDPDLVIRKKGWHKTRKAKVIAVERKGLYENGMTCSEIDVFLDTNVGYTYNLLKRYYPEILIPAAQQRKKSQRKALAIANKELTNAGQILSRQVIARSK